MSIKQIIFPEINKAELIEIPEKELAPCEVKVKTFVSTISCGTERANITGDSNVNAWGEPSVVFPRWSGYSSAGIVEEVGADVKSVKPGDRAVVWWGNHKDYNIINEKNVVKIEYDNVSFEEAAISFIGTFPMAAVRKTRVEVGESAMVMGLGILGLLAVKILRAAGAAPIIAVDPNPKRREEALEYGADFAYDPFETDFVERVKEVTGGGVNVAIEVTGVGAGLNEALDCMKKFGRVALLGCTRNAEFSVDYYRKVHAPGITLIGAHTLARPDVESHPGWFTHPDDIKAILKLCSMGRMSLEEMVKETNSPKDCSEVYKRLIEDKNFPTVVQFDWRRL